MEKIDTTWLDDGFLVAIDHLKELLENIEKDLGSGPAIGISTATLLRHIPQYGGKVSPYQYDILTAIKQSLDTLDADPENKVPSYLENELHPFKAPRKLPGTLRTELFSVMFRHHIGELNRDSPTQMERYYCLLKRNLRTTGGAGTETLILDFVSNPNHLKSVTLLLNESLGRSKEEFQSFWYNVVESRIQMWVSLFLCNTHFIHNPSFRTSLIYGRKSFRRCLVHWCDWDTFDTLLNKVLSSSDEKDLARLVQVVYNRMPCDDVASYILEEFHVKVHLPPTGQLSQIDAQGALTSVEGL